MGNSLVIAVSQFQPVPHRHAVAQVSKTQIITGGYGTWQKWYDADDPEYNAFLGYDKVKFTLVMPDGRTFIQLLYIVLQLAGGKTAHGHAAIFGDIALGQGQIEGLRRVPCVVTLNPSVQLKEVAHLIQYQTVGVTLLDGVVSVPKPAADYVKKLNSKGFDVVVAALEDNRRVTSMFPAQPSEKNDRKSFGGRGRVAGDLLHISLDLLNKGVQNAGVVRGPAGKTRMAHRARHRPL